MRRRSRNRCAIDRAHRAGAGDSLAVHIGVSYDPKNVLGANTMTSSGQECPLTQSQRGRKNGLEEDAGCDSDARV